MADGNDSTLSDDKVPVKVSINGLAVHAHFFKILVYPLSFGSDLSLYLDIHLSEFPDLTELPVNHRIVTSAKNLLNI